MTVTNDSAQSELLTQIIDAGKLLIEMRFQHEFWENECRDAVANAQRAGCGVLVCLKPLMINANVFVPHGQIMIVTERGNGTIEN